MRDWMFQQDFKFEYEAIVAGYSVYFFNHEDRTHLGLGKQTPADRRAAVNTTMSPKVISMPRLGGLHHRYNLAA